MQPVPVSDLPEELGKGLQNACSVYQMLAYLIALDVVDERLAILPIHHRILRTWQVAEPFIQAEREKRGYQLSYLNLFEALAMRVRRMDVSEVVGSFLKRLHA
jgi:hypothetical protein